jgi:hypothetical protein
MLATAIETNQPNLRDEFTSIKVSIETLINEITNISIPTDIVLPSDINLPTNVNLPTNWKSDFTAVAQPTQKSNSAQSIKFAKLLWFWLLF